MKNHSVCFLVNDIAIMLHVQNDVITVIWNHRLINKLPVSWNVFVVVCFDPQGESESQEEAVQEGSQGGCIMKLIGHDGYVIEQTLGEDRVHLGQVSLEKIPTLPFQCVVFIPHRVYVAA